MIRKILFLGVLGLASLQGFSQAKPKPKAGTLATVVMTIVVEEVYPIARKVVVSQAKQLIRGVTCTGKSGTANYTPHSCKTN